MLYAGSSCINPENGFPVFAFRLHQFISRGDTVWASLEDEDSRVITLKGQQYVPGDRNKVLLPLVFCRHCGHPYYRVDRPGEGLAGPVVPREDYRVSGVKEIESVILPFKKNIRGLVQLRIRLIAYQRIGLSTIGESDA